MTPRGVLVAVLLVLLAVLPAPGALAGTVPEQPPGPVSDPYACADLLEDTGLRPGRLRPVGPERSGPDLVPVLFVHGFNSSADTWRRGTDDPDPVLTHGISLPPDPARTFAERVLDVPGTAGFTFDYRAASLQWVTNAAIGPALGTVIDCLSTATGNRVVIVAHSMGGLAARQALATPERADRVAAVVTLGTPNTGSDFAAAFGSGDSDPAGLARQLLLAGCTRELARSGSEIGGACEWEGLNLLAASTTPAARALRTGSAELSALPPWPPSVRVVAIAGETTIELVEVLPGLGSIDAAVGDVVVDSASALDGATRRVMFDCRVDGTVILQPIAATVNALRQAALALTSPCFHLNLTRLTDAAVYAASATRRAVLEEVEDTDPLVAPRPQTDPGPLVFLVDTSGSMAQTDAAGVARLESAQAALLDQIRTISDDRPAALWTYPAGDGTCAAGGYRLPPTLGSAVQLDAEIRALRAEGDTPTGPAISALVASLQAAGESRATIVLVSDGESNCGDDPCEVAADVAGQGFDLQVDTVGFQISDAGRDELACIAGGTGGTYLDVQDGEALRQQLRTASQPVLTPVLSAPGTAGPGTEVTVEATLGNLGAVAATDVTLALRAELLGSGGQVTGFAAVTRPVIRLGNLGPGASGEYRWTATVPVGSGGSTLRFVLVTTAGNIAVDTRTADLTVGDRLTSADLGPILGDAASTGPAVLLGDSFTSGEGAGDYVRATPGIPDRCHRSPATYGADLFGQGRHVLACSGATIRALTTPQSHTDGSAPPQLEQLADLPDPIGLVLLTLGGNDIGFSGIVTRCVSSPWDCTAESGRTRELLTGLAERLASSYAAVHSVANSPQRRAERSGAVAPIVVLPYPHLLTRQPAGSCPGLSRTEADRAVALVDTLNAQIAAAVAQARAAGVPAVYAADVAQALQPAHTLCTDDPWVNPIDDLAEVLAPERRQELMHPDARGYEAITAALIRWSQREQPPLPDTAPGPTPTLVGTDVLAGAQPLQLGVDGAELRRGGAVTVLAAGFAPGEEVLVVQRSVVGALGTGYADARGELRLTVAVPGDAPVGDHRVVAIGVGADGNPREVGSRVTLSGEAPLWLWSAAGALALAALLAGALLIRSTRRRRFRGSGLPA